MGLIVVIYNVVDWIFKKDVELIDYCIDFVIEGIDV